MIPSNTPQADSAASITSSRLIRDYLSKDERYKSSLASSRDSTDSIKGNEDKATRRDPPALLTAPPPLYSARNVESKEKRAMPALIPSPALRAAQEKAKAIAEVILSRSSNQQQLQQQQQNQNQNQNQNQQANDSWLASSLTRAVAGSSAPPPQQQQSASVKSMAPSMMFDASIWGGTQTITTTVASNSMAGSATMSLNYEDIFSNISIGYNTPAKESAHLMPHQEVPLSDGSSNITHTPSQIQSLLDDSTVGGPTPAKAQTPPRAASLPLPQFTATPTSTLTGSAPSSNRSDESTAELGWTPETTSSAASQQLGCQSTGPRDDATTNIHSSGVHSSGVHGTAIVRPEPLVVTRSEAEALKKELQSQLYSARPNAWQKRLFVSDTTPEKKKGKRASASGAGGATDACQDEGEGDDDGDIDMEQIYKYGYPAPASDSDRASRSNSRRSNNRSRSNSLLSTGSNGGGGGVGGSYSRGKSPTNTFGGGNSHSNSNADTAVKWIEGKKIDFRFGAVAQDSPFRKQQQQTQPYREFGHTPHMTFHGGGGRRQQQLHSQSPRLRAQMNDLSPQSQEEYDRDDDEEFEEYEEPRGGQHYAGLYAGYCSNFTGFIAPPGYGQYYYVGGGVGVGGMPGPGPPQRKDAGCMPPDSPEFAEAFTYDSSIATGSYSSSQTTFVGTGAGGTGAGGAADPDLISPLKSSEGEEDEEVRSGEVDKQNAPPPPPPPKPARKSSGKGVPVAATAVVAGCSAPVTPVNGPRGPTKFVLPPPPPPPPGPMLMPQALLDPAYYYAQHCGLPSEFNIPTPTDSGVGGIGGVGGNASPMVYGFVPGAAHPMQLNTAYGAYQGFPPGGAVPQYYFMNAQQLPGGPLHGAPFGYPPPPHYLVHSSHQPSQPQSQMQSQQQQQQQPPQFHTNYPQRTGKSPPPPQPHPHTHTQHRSGSGPHHHPHHHRQHGPTSGGGGGGGGSASHSAAYRSYKAAVASAAAAPYVGVRTVPSGKGVKPVSGSGTTVSGDSGGSAGSGSGNSTGSSGGSAGGGDGGSQK